jgi:prepilin-type N-terminal cleavage/methylation domain-containing protein
MTSRRAFSMIEVMVVVAVVALLASLAVIRFRSSESSVTESKAKTELTQATASIRLFEKGSGYLPSTPTELEAAEPSFTWQSGAAAEPDVISVATGLVGTDTAVGLAQITSDGVCVLATVLRSSAAAAPIRQSVTTPTCTAALAFIFQPGATPW